MTNTTKKKKDKGAVPYVGEYTSRILKTFDYYNLRLGIRNSQLIAKLRSNDKIKEKDRNNYSGCSD